LSEEAPTPGASETDPGGTAAPGTAVDGGAGGTPSTADGAAFAAERERLETTIRTLQGAKDKARAELAAATKPKEDVSTAAAPAAATAEELMELFERRQSMREAATALKSEYPLARADLFEKAMSYDSPEAFKVAVEDSHNAVNSLVATQLAAKETELRAAYAAKYGELPDAPPAADGGTGDGMPTAKEAAGWSFAEIDAFIAKHGEEAWARIVRSS
jgi:hypothetical protein